MKYDIISRLKTIVNVHGPKYFEYDDPIASCIIDTADPHLWMLDNFPKKVWKFMSSNEISNYSASNYEKLTIIIIKKLKEHL